MINIRIMTIDDYDGIRSLWLKNHETVTNAIDDSRDGIEKYLNRNPTTSFVAENNGKIIGTIMAGHDGRRGFFHHVFISPDYRGKGIGRKLVDNAMNALENEGITKALEGDTRIIMEATGAYHLPILLELQRAGLFVSVINPLAMKKYASTSIRKGKTDKMNAIRIANYGIDRWFKLTEFKASEEVYAQLRLLGRQYAHYIKLRVSAKLTLTNLLDQTMPGIKKLLTAKRPDAPTRDKLSDFVETYWHYDLITQKSEKQFVNCYVKWARKWGYHASEKKAQGETKSSDV